MSYTLVLEWMPGDLYMSAVTARCTAPTSSYSVVWLPPNKVYQITLYCGSTSLVSFLVGAFRGKAWSYMSTNEKGTPQSRTYTVNDIAAILGIGRASAYKLANSGLFKTIRIGNMIRISRKSFEDWLKAEGLDDETE